MSKRTKFFFTRTSDRGSNSSKYFKTRSKVIVLAGRGRALVPCGLREQLAGADKDIGLSTMLDAMKRSLLSIAAPQVHIYRTMVHATPTTLSN